MFYLSFQFNLILAAKFNFKLQWSLIMINWGNPSFSTCSSFYHQLELSSKKFSLDEAEHSFEA